MKNKNSLYLHGVPGQGVGPEVHDDLAHRPDVPDVVEDDGVVAGRRAQQVRLNRVELHVVYRVYAPLECSERD
jgi:hypothetical protein